MYRTELHFNAIYVIESLGLGEPKTGRDLYDSVVFPATVRLDGLYTRFCHVDTIQSLQLLLRDIAYAAREANHRPFIHLEAHGDETGLQLADGTIVKWTDITPLLAAINEACAMNLCVVAMACQGWGLTHSLMPAERAPVFMLIGPPENITARELLAATRRFYSALVLHLDVNEALEAMNEGRPFEEWTIRPATAEILFCRVFRHYLEENGTVESLRQQENSLIAKMAKERQLDVLQTAMLREHMRPFLADREWWYNHLRTPFLMLDRFPENAGRFGLTYQLCIPPETT